MEIMLAGSGGQGILFLGNILSLAAAEKGMRVVTTPSYGAAVRGGDVKCGVIISDEEILDPVVDEADITVALSEASLKQFAPKGKEGGTLIYERSEKTTAIVASLNKQFQLISIPLLDLGPARYHNMIAMGVLLQIYPDLNFDLIEDVLTKDLKKRNKESFLEENLKAIREGSRWYLGEKGKQRGCHVSNRL